MKNQFEPGQAVETTIVQISGDTVFIDLGLKSEGFIDKAELTDDKGNLTVKEGDKIKAYFASARGDELKFTTKIAGGNAGAAELESAYKSQIPVEGHVEKEIKGGFEVKIGSVRAFCPYSQMGYKNRAEASAYIGQHLTFLITEYKNEGKNIVLSNRRILEQEESSKKSSLAAKLTVGTRVKGPVTRIESYGAFINLGGFEALLPISEISHARVNKVEDVLSVGEEIEVEIIRADWERNKVSVSLKNLEKDPWDSAEDDFKPGDKIDGKISRIAGFGLFVELAPGIDGLVHISTLEDVGANTNLAKKYKVGQDFSVVVEKVDSENRRISLKPASSAEQDTSAKDYLASQDDDADTYNPFAALLKK